MDSSFDVGGRTFLMLFLILGGTQKSRTKRSRNQSSKASVSTEVFPNSLCSWNIMFEALLPFASPLCRCLEKMPPLSVKSKERFLPLDRHLRRLLLHPLLDNRLRKFRNQFQLPPFELVWQQGNRRHSRLRTTLRGLSMLLRLPLMLPCLHL